MMIIFMMETTSFERKDGDLSGGEEEDRLLVDLATESKADISSSRWQPMNSTDVVVVVVVVAGTDDDRHWDRDL